MAKKGIERAKGHTVYRTADGKRVPGTTTITGVIDKSRFLVPWANRLGREEGIDTKNYVDALAAAGTAAHLMVECWFTGDEADLSEVAPADVDLAENSFIKFLDWTKQHVIVPIGNEMILVSERYRYGGMCDIYCELDGKKALIDIKTSKRIYDEAFTQVAGGYRPLLLENGYPVDDTYILRIGRTEDEGFEFLSIPRQELHRKRFLLCRELYEINKKL